LTRRRNNAIDSLGFASYFFPLNIHAISSSITVRSTILPSTIWTVRE
jgi:hypothetical protein